MARAEFFNLRHDYTEQAAGYLDRRFGDASGRLYNDVHRCTVDALLGEYVNPVAQGLEVAPGPGRLTDVVRRRVAAPLCVVELADGMIAHLRQARRDRWPDVAVVQGDAFTLPFNGGLFDVVATFRFIHLFAAERQHALMCELARVLRPGGHLLVEFNNRRYGGVLPCLRERGLAVELRETYTTIGALAGAFPGGRLLAVRGVGFPLRLGALYQRRPDLALAINLRLGRWRATRGLAQQLLALWVKT
jgi:ubiquinone/menaquinone biosynthesis C-methylase UbiE